MNQEILSHYCDYLDELGECLANHLIRKLHQELVKSVGREITGNQFVVLKIIDMKERRTVSEVAEQLYISLSAVTTQIDRLCRLGLVIRSRSEEDRRVVWLQLTDKGREMVQQCDLIKQQMIMHYLKQFKEDELIQMVAMGKKLIKIISADDQSIL